MADPIRLLKWFPALAILAFIVIVACWKTGTVATPDWITAIDQSRAELVAANDGEVCMKLGFASGSPAQSECKTHLLGVRLHDRQVNTF